MHLWKGKKYCLKKRNNFLKVITRGFLYRRLENLCNSPYNNPMNNDILGGEEMVKIYYILYLILFNIIMSFILVVSAQISETSDTALYFLISYMVIIFLNILFSYFFAKTKINKKDLMRWTLTVGIIKFFLPFLELIRMILFNNRFFENPIIISIITLIFFIHS